MASQKHGKKEGSLKDLFAKTPAKRMAQTAPLEAACGDAAGPGLLESDGAPLTRAFREQLFESLRDDLATLKREIAADIKDLKREVIDLGQRVDTMEQAQDTREEELDCHRRERLSLQDKNQELQYQIEDLEIRSRRSNIRIKGVLTQAVVGPLEDFVVRLFHHVAPVLKEQDIVLDRTHRAGRPARAPGQAQDILTCLHYYKQRAVIMAVISLMTLQRRRLLRPVTDLLREKGIKYQWCHPFRVLFTSHNELRSIRTLEEAQRLDGMSQNFEERAQKVAPLAQRRGTDRGQSQTVSHRRKACKPSKG
ncbi:hypothetical protein NDU88_006957 [Pleurodeles waltl]|uniref:Uncharacterized protein n=1 Tax=Pleurodeles waltl TaxID=8319 RepID=A0AAV7U230_PLEWA|nr:hypothetical protein NDU88_006957 [Pleurodeles waltl]